MKIPPIKEPTKEQCVRLKEIEIEAYNAFKKVCDELSLSHFVVGGTLIGAVRHKGFIPWDDDLDVAMPRKDYDIFMANAQKMLPQYYFVQNYSTDPEYLYNFGKIRDCRTTFIEYSAVTNDIHHGVFIDIFPLDYYPEDQKEVKKYNKWKGILGNRISSAYYPHLKRDFKGKIKSLASKILVPSAKKAVLKKELFMRKTKKSGLFANYCGAWGDREICPVEWFDGFIEMPFENTTVRAPKGYHEWLTKVYGDYMTLPPEEKRKGHHYTVMVDLENPYTDYKNLYGKGVK